jgi:SAM-dependent methyltransferase
VGDLRVNVPATTSSEDPSPLFELYRGSYATELLVVATAHLGVFGHLAEGPLSGVELAHRLGLERRPFQVLMTGLRAMGTVGVDGDGRYRLTPMAEAHLVAGCPHDVGDYFSLAAASPGVLALLERLRTNRPANADGAGAGFIYRDGIRSAMEGEAGARFFTMALAGRAKTVAPVLAEVVSLGEAIRLLDVGGGTGLYSLAFLRANPGLKAVVWDRPEVLRVAAEFAEGSGLEGRMELRAGDMFTDPVPEGVDVVLLSNILHDWDEAECVALLGRLGAALGAGTRLLIHDVFLDDDLGGPLPVALYSAALFSLTEGRAYSAAEYGLMLAQTGFRVLERRSTRVHCGVLVAERC